MESTSVTSVTTINQKYEKGFCPASPCQRANPKLFYIYPQNGTFLAIKHVKQQPNTKNTVHLQTKAKDYEANVILVL